MVSPSATELALKRHADPVWHVCFLYFGNSPDAQDAFQETFVKLLSYGGEFNGPEHEKAWLITVASNVCRDMLKRFDCKKATPSDGSDFVDLPSSDCFAAPGGAVSEALAAMSALPRNHRMALYLCAVQGYTAEEAARMMDSSTNTVYSWVARARTSLKEMLA